MLLIFTIFAFVLVVTVNALANILPINGQTTGEISNQLEVLFTPAGYVFSIWGVIYFLLAYWLVTQLMPQARNDPAYIKVRWLFVISCALNVAWILCWHYEWFGLSVIVMLCLLLTLIFIYLALDAKGERYIRKLPFSVYLAWISVATVANISYYLTSVNWDGWALSPENWTIIMMLIATLLASIFLWRHADIAYAVVFIWALVGIGVANLSGSNEVYLTAFAFAGLLAVQSLMIAINVIQQKKRS